MIDPVDRPVHRRFSVRVSALSIVLAGGAVVACGSDGKKAEETLPPIATTTTTTTMPPTTTTLPEFYVISPGDTLFTIAQMFGLTTDELAAYNNIVDKNHIELGQKLKIPPAGAASTTTVVSSVAPTVTEGAPVSTTVP
jgi:LysM repeat protein